MVLRPCLLAFISFLLTFSISFDTLLAHFCKLRLEGAGILVLRHIFLTLLGPIGVLLSAMFRPMLAVALFLPTFQVHVVALITDHSFSPGGGRVVRWCWVNFQCRGVLQFGLQ